MTQEEKQFKEKYIRLLNKNRQAYVDGSPDVIWARRLKREERKLRRQSIAEFLILAAIILCLVVLMFAPREEATAPPTDPPCEVFTQSAINAVDHPTRTYYRDDIPLDHYQQETLYNACQEWDVPYELALAVCWRETGFRDLVTTNDTGTYYGMMAVQGASAKRYMEQCGVEYLNSEEDRLRVGCCILGYYLDQYDNNIHRALMSYNAGQGTAASQWALGVYHTTYTIDIMNYMKNLME